MTENVRTDACVVLEALGENEEARSALGRIVRHVENLERGAYPDDPTWRPL